MQEEFLTFHKFTDKESANEFGEDLSRAGITYRIEHVNSILDRAWIGEMANTTYSLKIRAEDFEKANAYLDDHYGKLIDTLDKDYYLFSFTNEELFEIIAKPDEWGHLDRHLAKKLMADRGHSIDGVTMARLKENRKNELAKPDKDGGSLLVFGYIFIALGLISLYKDFGFVYAPYVVVFSLLAGSLLSFDKKVLPDGTKVYSYDPDSRKHGKIIMITAIIILGFSIFNFLRPDPYS